MRLLGVLLLLLALSSSSPIRHVVVVMLENNSFDRLFLGLNASASFCNRDKNGAQHCTRVTSRLVPGCDPDHTVGGTTK